MDLGERGTADCPHTCLHRLLQSWRKRNRRERQEVRDKGMRDKTSKQERRNANKK
jgi:hypothetical protein